MAGEPAESVPAANQTVVLLRGIAGAVAGGIAGYFAFNFLAARGLYGLMIPGLLLGMAAGITARGKSQALGIVCAAAALALMIVAEWHRAPMVKDQSLTYFVTHLHQMNNATVKF